MSSRSRIWVTCAALGLQLAACGAARHAARPAWRSIAEFEAAAQAHQCRFDHVVRELGAVEPGVRGRRRIRDQYAESGTIVESGAETYRVRRVRDEPEGPARYEVSRTGAAPIWIGVDVVGRDPVVAADGSGAVVLWWLDLESHEARVAVIDRERVVDFDIRSVVHDLALARVDGGWLLAADRVREGWAVWRLGVEGTIEVALDLGGAVARRALAAESAGVVAAAFTVAEGIGFASTLLGEGVVRVVDHDEAPAAYLVPEVLVSSDAGFWIVVRAEWSEPHRTAAPPEWRFIHVAPDGTVLGRAAARLSGSSVLEDAHLEGDQLHARVAPWNEASWAEILVESAACEPVPPGPCDPRSWPRDAERPRLTDARPASTSAAGASPAAAPSAAGSCRGRAGDLIVSAVTGERDLRLLDAAGRELWSTDGEWWGCELAVLPNRILLAGSRVHTHSSAGPLMRGVVYVFSTDGRLLATHEIAGSEGAPDMLADDGGAWLVWRDPSMWNFALWRLDAEGSPVGEPRALATLYYLPGTRVVATELGPSLVWSTWNEEGVVPFCHAAELDEAPRNDGYVGSMTIPVATSP